MNTRLIGVCVLALVLATAVVADTEVAVANADTEVQAQAAVAAVAETAAAAQTQAAAATETAAAAQTEAKAEAKTETAAVAATETAAAAETQAAAATETTAAAAAGTEAAAAAAAAAPANAKASKPAPKTFKPTMINRDSRLAMRSQRSDIRYTDGSLAPILTFGPRPESARLNSVEADVVAFPNGFNGYGNPLARRFARWADAVSERKQKYITPKYADEQSRRRYVSYVPDAAFFAPRRPTHFEPEYKDEHAVLEAADAWANGDLQAYFAAFGAPVIPAPRAPSTFEAEYDDEHALLNGELPQEVEYVFDVDLDDLLDYQRSVYPRRASAFDTFGLPEFPALPPSAARHLAKTQIVPPFSGLDDPIPSGVHIKSSRSPVVYPSGTSPKAELKKLDFALNRLQSLNKQLRAAEAKVRASRAEQKALNSKLQRLQKIRADLQRLAEQISALEGRVGRDPRVQAEVARVAGGNVRGVPVLGEWLSA